MARRVKLHAPEQAVWHEPPKPERPDLNGHKAITANICYDCGGELRAADGTFSERLIDTARIAFAAAICNHCRQGRPPDGES